MLKLMDTKFQFCMNPTRAAIIFRANQPPDKQSSVLSVLSVALEWECVCYD